MKKKPTEPMLTVELGDQIYLSGDVKDSVIDALKQRLIMENPEWVESDRRGYYTGNIPRQLSFIENDNGIWTMPRGFTYELYDILVSHRCFFVLDYITKIRELPKVEFNFNGKLKEHQEKASKPVLKNLFGVASLPTGAGKTVLALYCIAKRRQPALVVVHTKTLLYQWRDEAKKFLGLNDDEIGLIGDGKKKVGEKLTIAIINSLHPIASEVKNKIGFLIVDECHRVPADTFKETVSAFDCKYMLGLSATPRRTDGLTDLIHFYLGRLVYDADSREYQDQGIIMQPRVITRNTGLEFTYNGNYTRMITTLTNDHRRNQMIAGDVVGFYLAHSGTALVVSERINHCEELENLISERMPDVTLLTGDTAKGKRKQIISDANDGKIEVLVATLNLISEGFDCKNLSALFIATPFRSATKLQQLVGRILRTAEGKEPPLIFDYVDRGGVLQASYRARFQAYRDMGATLEPSDI